eukprot:Skav226721  [mRNA]  locus=scaffold3813:50419:51912:+ [translate_table: standard]
MKRPSGRNHGKQVHRCVCCGSTKHRLETCNLPGAKVLQTLRREVRTLRRQSDSKKVLRQQKKTRLSPHSRGKFKAQANLRYAGSRAGQDRARPSEQRLVRRELLEPEWGCEQEAFQWLVCHGFVKNMKKCPECGKKNVLQPKFDSERSAHFRCSPCGQRFPWLQKSDFVGMRCSPVKLAKLLTVYSSLDMMKAPAIQDLVTLPGARPPTESKHQVIASGFLKQVNRKKGKTCCFFDGNKAWASECRRLDIMFRQVSHQDHEYAKRVAATPVQLSNWGGTQAMDRWWLSLKKFIPPSLNRKKAALIPASLSGKKATVVHPHVALLLYQ